MGREGVGGWRPRRGMLGAGMEGRGAAPGAGGVGPSGLRRPWRRRGEGVFSLGSPSCSEVSPVGGLWVRPGALGVGGGPGSSRRGRGPGPLPTAGWTCGEGCGPSLLVAAFQLE